MKRSIEKEIIDLGPEHYTLEEYNHSQKMLFRINKMLGIFGNAVRLCKKYSTQATVLDVGCGGGLFLLNLSKRFPLMNLLGVDVSEDAIKIANKELENFQRKKAKINVSFYLQNNPIPHIPEKSIDIILLTLVCHHLSDEELMQLLPQLQAYTREMIVIYDLHRHIIPLIFYKLFSWVLFRNRLISNDGFISIKRGFKRDELTSLLIKAGIKNFQIKWCFPFYWRVLIAKNEL